jgi:hypothetical protein
LRKPGWTLAALGLSTALLAAGGVDLEEKTTLRDSWTFPGGTKEIEVSVDNIEGSIVVTGCPGRTVELVAAKTIRATLPERLQRAKDEVQLRITKREDLFEAYVDAPWRCKEGRRQRSERSPGYRVSFDFELRVPAEARLFLRTINNGEIKVEGVGGDYDIDNVNGGIEMVEVSGSGRAYALNGKLRAVFRSNPQRDSYFGSLNGDVDLYLQPNLAADLRLKTFNGEIYSDFPVRPLPGGPVTRETRNGKYVYRTNDFFGVRVGQGGPEIKLDGFNGDIRIHERKR